MSAASFEVMTSGRPSRLMSAIMIAAPSVPPIGWLFSLKPNGSPWSNQIVASLELLVVIARSTTSPSPLKSAIATRASIWLAC